MSFVRKKYSAISFTAAMADLALLLLIFFMATTSMITQQNITVDLPKAQSEGVDQNNLYISITEESKIIFEEKEVSLAEIDNLLLNRRNDLDKKIAIAADQSVPYEIVSELLEILKKNDFLNIVFISQTEEK